MKKKPTDKQFRAKLRELRKQRGLSQSALADLIGPTDTQIQNYEHARSGVGIDRLDQLAKALGCEPNDLLIDASDHLGGADSDRLRDIKKLDDLDHLGTALDARHPCLRPLHLHGELCLPKAALLARRDDQHRRVLIPFGPAKRPD